MLLEVTVRPRPWIAMIGLMLLGCAGRQVDSPSAERPAATAVAAPVEARGEFAGFDVDVTLSDSAKKRLVQVNETVIVVGYLSGVPKKGALKEYVTEKSDEVSLGEVKEEIAPGANAKFGVIHVKAEALAQTDGNGPQLLINVYSGRRSSHNNLLVCVIYQGALKAIADKHIPIACKCIGE